MRTHPFLNAVVFHVPDKWRTLRCSESKRPLWSLLASVGKKLGIRAGDEFFVFAAAFYLGYSFFEMAALEARYRFCNEDGDPYPDEQALAVMANYVKVENFGKNGVKAVRLSPLAKKLFEIRKGNTHHIPLSIMESGSNLPLDFSLGRLRDEGVPALGFALEVLALVEQVQRELDA